MYKSGGLALVTSVQFQMSSSNSNSEQVPSLFSSAFAVALKTNQLKDLPYDRKSLGHKESIEVTHSTKNCLYHHTLKQKQCSHLYSTNDKLWFDKEYNSYRKQIIDVRAKSNT